MSTTERVCPKCGGKLSSISLQTRTNGALVALQDELHSARQKFPKNRLMLAALMEEVGELAKAIIEGGDWQEEALHVACVAIRIMTEDDSTHGLELPE